MKKLIIGLVIIVILIGGYIFLNSKPDQISSAEQEKKIAQILGRKPNLNPDIKTGDILYKGRYVSLKYPASAKIYAPKDSELLKNKNVIEAFSFDMYNPRLILNLTVMNGDPISSKISDISAVAFRQNKSSGYNQSEINAGGFIGLAFTKEPSSGVKAEKTGFFVVNKRVYTLSVTGNNLEDAAKLFDEIIKSISFI